MRLTIFRSDSTVIIDGRGFNVDCSSIPEMIRVVQWDIDHGEIEMYLYNGTIVPNCPIESIDDFSSVIDAWEAARVVADAPVTPPDELPIIVPTSASKLGLKRAFQELGMWTQVKAMISSDEDVQEEWDLAIEVKKYDPLVQNLIAVLQLTDEQVTSLILRANQLVA